MRKTIWSLLLPTDCYQYIVIVLFIAYYVKGLVLGMFIQCSKFDISCYRTLSCPEEARSQYCVTMRRNSGIGTSTPKQYPSRARVSLLVKVQQYRIKLPGLLPSRWAILLYQAWFIPQLRSPANVRLQGYLKVHQRSLARPYSVFYSPSPHFRRRLLKRYLTAFFLSMSIDSVRRE